MFKSFWGSNDQQSQASTQEASIQSWYPPSVVGSSSSRPSTPSISSPGNTGQRKADLSTTHSYSQLPPVEAASIITVLKDKSVDELRKLLTDKSSYDVFFNSLDQVKIQNNLQNELKKETLQLARENLEREPRISELRNQCRVIRTTELAAAQEKLSELEKQKEEIIKDFAPFTLLQRLHDVASKSEEESDVLHSQLLAKEIDLITFIQKYKRMRITYHRLALMHLGAQASI